MKCSTLLSTAAMLIIAGGCTVKEPEVPKIKMVMGIPHDDTVKYAKISTENLSLKMISSPTLYAGDDGIILFSVANKGRKMVSIPEWYAYEPDNLTLYIQPWLPGMSAPDPEGWVALKEDMKKPIMHYPLTLMPDNQVMVEKKLHFIKKSKIAKGMARRYFIKAKSNLGSLLLESDVFAIQVLPRASAGANK